MRDPELAAAIEANDTVGLEDFLLNQAIEA
jgi:hypothetical protein